MVCVHVCACYVCMCQIKDNKIKDSTSSCTYLFTVPVWLLILDLKFSGYFVYCLSLELISGLAWCRLLMLFAMRFCSHPLDVPPTPTHPSTPHAHHLSPTSHSSTAGFNSSRAFVFLYKARQNWSFTWWYRTSLPQQEESQGKNLTLKH